MLWKKESDRRDALYVNIFRSLGKEDEYAKSYRAAQEAAANAKVAKSNAKAVKLRKDGNEYLPVEAALTVYFNNVSLMFAEEGSKHTSFAYANRSTGYYHKKMYKRCLIDINLAREAGYPQHLMPKLDKREANCLKFIEEGASQDDSDGCLKLSFTPHENYPDLANVLEFSRDENGKPTLVATEDIDACQGVVVEKGFHTHALDRHEIQCNICLALSPNKVPCKKCTTVLFCHDGCQHNDLHQYECGLKFFDDKAANDIAMSTVRTVCMAINLFPSVDDLTEFVEAANNSDPNEIPDTLSTAKSKYRAFLKLPLNETLDLTDSLEPFCVYKKLLEVPKINMMFQAEHHQRFFMHLVCLHSEIVQTHSSIALIEERNHSINTKISLVRRYLKWSCAPNVMVGAAGGSLKFITVRPIKAGQQLTTSPFEPWLESKKRRQQHYKRFDYICKCTRCEGVYPSAEQKKQIRSDPLYRSIQMNKTADLSDEEVKTLVTKCKTFLRKYGELPWCKEIDRITDIYMQLPEL